MTDDDQHAMLQKVLGQVRDLLEWVPLMDGERPWNRDDKVNAVNELDTLIDKVAALEKEKDETDTENYSLSQDLAAALTDRGEARAELEIAETRIAELEARVAELEHAAKPEHEDKALALIREFQRDTAQV